MVGVKVIQNLPDLLIITDTINLIIPRLRGLPQHNTPKCLRILVHVLLHQGLDLFRGQIIPKVRSRHTSGQTNVKLRVGVGTRLDNLDPAVVIETVLGAQDKVASRAARCVIELDPNKIDDSVLDGNTKLFIRDGALGRGRDVKGLIRNLLEAPAETLDHVGVACSSQHIIDSVAR